MAEALLIAQLVMIGLSLLPPIIKFVELTANELKETGVVTSGEEKKQAVLDAFYQMWNGLATAGQSGLFGSKVFVQLPADVVTKTLSTTIDSIVSTYNKLKIFTKSDPTPVIPVK